MDKNKALNAEEVAAKLSIAKNTVYELIKRGELKSYKVGRKVRIDQVDLEEYIIKSKNSITLNNELIINDKTVPQSFIISGQDRLLDILGNILENHKDGVKTLRSYTCSFPGLINLYYDKCQVTSVHLWDWESDEYNIDYVKKLVPGVPCILINIAKRTQGFFVKKGNPKNIKSWLCLERDDVKIINREKGSGTRVLLDGKIKSNFMSPSKIDGYYDEKTNHIAVANHVANGYADVGLGSEAAYNGIQGIDFIPMKTESYDIVIKKENFNNPIYKLVYDIICSDAYKNSINNFIGYDFTDLGRIVGET